MGDADAAISANGAAAAAEGGVAESQEFSEQAAPPAAPAGEFSPPTGGADRAEPLAPAAAPAPPASGMSPWLGRLFAVGGGIGGWLSHPRARLAVMGVVLLAMAGLVVSSSVWTLPLVIVGVLMVLIAWIGSRLAGHFVVEWGKSGTQLELRAEIRSAQSQHLHTRFRHASAVAGLLEVVPDEAEVVEGAADTVEIDIGELKALIAVAEADESRAVSSDVAPDGLSKPRPVRR